jgi:hypothetical protein
MGEATIPTPFGECGPAACSSAGVGLLLRRRPNWHPVLNHAHHCLASHDLIDKMRSDSSRLGSFVWLTAEKLFVGDWMSGSG